MEPVEVDKDPPPSSVNTSSPIPSHSKNLSSPFFEASPVPATGVISVPLGGAITEGDGGNQVGKEGNVSQEAEEALRSGKEKPTAVEDEVHELLDGNTCEEEFRTHGQTKYKETPYSGDHGDHVKVDSFLINVSPVSSPDPASSQDQE